MSKKHHQHHAAPPVEAPDESVAPLAGGDELASSSSSASSSTGAEESSVAGVEHRAPSPSVGPEAPAPEPAPDDRFLRLAAEYENFRRRTAKERLELTARAQGDLLRTLIDPLDDLARVIAQGPGAADAKTVLDAVEVVDKKMMKALDAAGLEIVNPVNQRFDPTLHEAVSMMPAHRPEQDQIIAQVFQPGYVFKGQLLRAARVVVMRWMGEEEEG